MFIGWDVVELAVQAAVVRMWSGRNVGFALDAGGGQRGLASVVVAGGGLARGRAVLESDTVLLVEGHEVGGGVAGRPVRTAGAVVSTDTDKNAALCSATSTSPMTHSTMKLCRIISRAERAR